MAEFKAGQKVINVSPTVSMKLVKGRTYEVERMSPSGSVKVVGVYGFWNPKRFRAVEERAPKPEPFGTVKAVSINKEDLLEWMSVYVNMHIGIKGRVTDAIAEGGMVRLVMGEAA